ncbi:hypothetical protein D3C76_1737890 [compost metagenome]
MVERQGQRILDATNIADADAQVRLVEAVIGKILGGYTVALRHLETAIDPVIGMEQARFVDAPGTGFGADLAVELKLLR